MASDGVGGEAGGVPHLQPRGARLGACCEHVRPATAAALRRGAARTRRGWGAARAISTSATLRWDALRAHHRRLSGVSGASAVLSAALRRSAMRKFVVVAMLADGEQPRRLTPRLSTHFSMREAMEGSAEPGGAA